MQADLFSWDQLPEQVMKMIEFHRKHPQHWAIFRRYADEAVNRRRKHIGAKMVIERMRWYAYIEAGRDEPFKVPNGLDTLYARMYNRLRERNGQSQLFREKSSMFEFISKHQLDTLIGMS